MSRSPAANWSAWSSSSAARPRSSSRLRWSGPGIPILGTSPDAIDLAEDRERFANLVHRLGLRQPENGLARSREEAIAVAERIGYPVLTRPSYVLGGRAMEIVDGPAQLDSYIVTAVQVSGDSPVLIDQYLRDAIEVDVDAISDGKDVAIAGVMQHIEEAGVIRATAPVRCRLTACRPTSSPRSSARRGSSRSRLAWSA
jgi:carbamoylphosphate synthase large subunit